MAEIRKQALLASGVQIEGLQQQSGNGPPAPKKVVYGNRKKKGPGAKDASPAPESRPRSPELASPTLPAAEEVKSNADEDLKSDWEACSDEETKAAAGVKDSWDASSEEDEASPEPAKPNETLDVKGGQLFKRSL